MTALRLATGPVTWGVDFADAPDNPPWEQVLDDIASSGLGALELGPVGYLPEDPETLRAALASRGLTAVGSFLFDDLHDPARRDEVLTAARRTCRAIAGAGGSVLVIIDRPGRGRAATAGRPADAARLPRPAWTRMLATIQAVADVARESGLTPTVHPHAGSCIEFSDELERLMDESDLALCLDTGHCAYAGMEPAHAIRDYGARIAHVHLKDVDGTVLGLVGGRALGFWAAVGAGIFCPVGHGLVDVSATLAALRDIGYAGHATIEQDRVPGHGEPLDDLRASIAVIRRAEGNAPDRAPLARQFSTKEKR